MLGLVSSQPRNNPPGDLVIIVDERYRSHGTPSPQSGNKLITGGASAIDSDFRQAILLVVEERHGLHRVVPTTHEELSHGQPKAAHHQQTEPPVVQYQRTRHHFGNRTIPVDHQGKHQRGNRHCLPDGDQCIVAEVAHHRAVHAETYEQRNGDSRRHSEQPAMGPERIQQVIHPQARNEGKPQRNPNQDDVSRDLQQTLVPSRKL
ncbi:hypothetical protein D3C76_795120 [compost metagenome]